MKVTNLKKKPFHIPVNKTASFLLVPASGVVELPAGYNENYVNALAKNGSIKIEVEVVKKAKKAKKAVKSEIKIEA